MGTRLMLVAIVGLVAAPLFSGCWQPEYADQEYIDAVPTAETLQVKLPATDTSKMMLYNAQLAEFYVMTHKTTYDINEGIAHILMWVNEILKYPVTSRDGDTYTWGPWRNSGLDPMEQKFTMGKGKEPDTFDFVFWGRPKNSTSEADWKPWIDGDVLKGSEPHHGIGSLVLHFTNAHELDPVLHPEVGQFQVEFDTINDPHDVAIELVAFQGPQDSAPVNGAYRYHEHADLSGDFSFTAEGNVIDESAAIERLAIRTRWIPTGEGLAEASVSGGDVDLQGFSGVHITECWDTNYLRSYYHDEIEGTEWHINPDEGDVATCPSFDDSGAM